MWVEGHLVSIDPHYIPTPGSVASHGLHDCNPRQSCNYRFAI